jgi:hypothetical protein
LAQPSRSTRFDPAHSLTCSAPHGIYMSLGLLPPPPHRFPPAPLMVLFSTAAALLTSCSVAAPPVYVQGRGCCSSCPGQERRCNLSKDEELQARKNGGGYRRRMRWTARWAIASREAAAAGGRACEVGWRSSKVLPQRSQLARRCESQSESNRTKIRSDRDTSSD